MITRIKKAIKILIDYDGNQKNVNNEDLVQRKRIEPWFAINGDKTLRLNYDLNSNSIVFDLGGYKGEFTTEILCKYNASVFIFEPVNEFFLIIKNKFSNNEKVKKFNFGLAESDKDLRISLLDNSSSVYLECKDSEAIQLKSIVDFITLNNIHHVDLIKINIEGGEYELLEVLIKSGLISVFKNIQVQFHDFFISNAKERMVLIQNELSKTHELTYQYEFVWENWRIK